MITADDAYLTGPEKEVSVSSWRIAGIIALAALLARCSVTSPLSVERYLDIIVVTDVDPTTLPDGCYPGQYTIVVPPGHYAAFRSFSVPVSVRGGAYDAISILRPAAMAANSGFTALIGRIESTNSLLVDGVRGATYSSRAMLKAVEAAVTQ